ncbi:MAG: hypothetical protein E1N59_986 [Puniceicoccaceae bacterium 5H]|nr:MAG: hypothetical protein E1N59_986 [Puniceicoccaceae bacterium 5H]
MSTTTPAKLPITDYNPARDTFRQDFIEGLSRPQKQVSPKYLYDARGAELFDQICEQEEYFPTRTEMGILRRHLDEIAARLGPRCRVVEFGSGSSMKTHLLLEHLDDPVCYVPIDIAREYLEGAGVRLTRQFPTLDILPVCADYTSRFDLPTASRAAERTVVFFPGSTIGNFTLSEAVGFLQQCRELCGPDGAVLIGVGLQTDPDTLYRAYNDRAGVTAAFNLNLLERARRELNARIDIASFYHHAIYDRERGRIEMRLVSQREQTVCVGDQRFAFTEGEHLLTEYSHKFTREGFRRIAEQAGLRPARVWTDPLERFSLQLLEPRAR